MNKVLDITQEIKDSLPKFVSCQDYDFAVALGIIAGKRDFLNYDAGLEDRIPTVGKEFMRSLVRYLYENVHYKTCELMNKANLAMTVLYNNLNQPQSSDEEKAH